MKISVNKDEEGYGNYLTHRPIFVFLDGVDVKNCVSLDADAGTVDFHPKRDGRFVFGDDGNLVVERAFGHVRVIGSCLDYETTIIDDSPDEVLRHGESDA